jgi:hypothetical protein
MEMKLLFSCFHLIFVLAFSLSFSFSQEIETKSSIRLVHNKKGGKWGNHPKISLELLKTVGDVNTLDENFAFHNPDEMALDTEGNLYILDSGNHRILKFSPQLLFLSSFGQRGQGPGDFQNPTSIEVDPQNFIYVADPRNNRISIFPPNSKNPRTINFPYFYTQKVRYMPNGKLAVGGFHSTGRWADEKKGMPKLLFIIDTKGGVQREIGHPYKYDKWIESWWGNRYDFDIDKYGNFHLAFEHQNRVEKYNSKGELQWRADRILNFDINDPEHMFTIIVGGRDGRNEATLPAKMSQGMAVDSKGRAWVLGFNRHLNKEEGSSEVTTSAGQVVRKEGNEIENLDVYKLEIFDGSGTLLGEIMLSHFADGIRIYEDSLFIWDVQNTKYYHYRILEEL